MRLLLDTHALLWWLDDDAHLGPQARDVIARSTSTWVSAASVWEISIKRALGKLDAPRDLLDALVLEQFEELQVSARHGWEAGRLPPHHSDPFDRLLVAQAVAEDLALLTADRRLADYEVQVLDART